MKVLLLQKIGKLGEIGSEINVKSGYARNYLFPNNLAVTPTEENIALIEKKKQELIAEENKLKDEALKFKDKFNNYSIILEAKINTEDNEDKTDEESQENRIYGSITLQNLVDRLIADGYDIQKKQVNLPSGSIKSLGNYKIYISLHPEVNLEIPVQVIKEKS